ncbi:putative isoaspartyl peptidase/L-asparaginase 2, partial [Mucuna pruriens]
MGKQHNYKEEGMTGLTVVSNFGVMAYGFNCNGMFSGCATKDRFMELGMTEKTLTSLVLTFESRQRIEPLGKAWEKIQEMLRGCSPHDFPKG